MTEPGKRPLWLRIGLPFAVWTLVGLILSSQAWALVYSAQNLPQALRTVAWNPSRWELVIRILAEAYIWAVLSVGIAWLARRFPLDGRQWPRNLAVHLAAGAAFAVAQTGLSVAVEQVMRPAGHKLPLSLEVLQYFCVAKFHSNLFIYGAILLLYHARAYYRKYRDRELRASRLEARLAQTRLQVLRMQLHPHFLFNTLNAISALVHQDVDTADRMIARLGDLLRSTLENADQQEVPLRRELDFVRPYLEIEQARLGPRLAVRVDADPEALDALVPNLILQPLVENAVRHGIAPRAEPGRLEIRAWRAGPQLHLQVTDDGPGLPPPGKAGSKEGIGLANTRARLQQLYGTAHRFELAAGPGGGLVVRITMPFRDQPEDGGPDLSEDSRVDQDLDRG